MMEGWFYQPKQYKKYGYLLDNVWNNHAGINYLNMDSWGESPNWFLAT